MANLIIAKSLTQGDTFKAGITVSRTINGIKGPVDLSAVTIKSQVKQLDGTLVATLTVTDVDFVNGKMQVRGETNTSLLAGNPAWPVEVFKWDIEFIEVGDTWSMPIRGINVTEDNTTP